MPYVSRGQNGNISGVFTNPQPGFATEFLQPTDPGLIKWTLLPYATAKQKAIAGGGVSVNIGAQSVECSTDAVSLVMLQGAFTLAEANNAATFNWVQSNGIAVTLTSANIITMFSAVTSFIQSTFNTLSAVLSAINAGTVTTAAQVDSFSSPAWPVNS